jgi:gliding motility-associated-like protein
MNTQITHRVFFWISFIVMFIQSQNEAFASHAQSADITYQCLGGNQYQVNLSFYRDCAGVAAPTTATIDISSASCGQNLTLTLNPINGTGIEVSPICSQMTTQCSGGTYPGVQEFKYSGIITLPMQCADWTFSFSLCCRNASINTIANPSAENIYVQAVLNNLDFPCNSSPSFSNPPIPFVCVGQPYCFNNGSSDADGDSLYYSLITPATGVGITVTYNNPYSSSQPLLSAPAVSFDNISGDMCMSPTSLEVTVFAVLVEEWRNGVLIGSVMRDIQLRTINCTNNNPYVNGINNTNTYSMGACAGNPVSFTVSSFDIDSSQNVTINWNNGIAGATFTSSGGSRPTGTFNWTPTAADVSTSPYCFTVTVRDDNCPYNGNQTYSFCITVSDLAITTSSTNANCGASNGTAQVDVTSGIGPFTYQWSEGSLTSNQNGLQAGTYTVSVTNAAGCITTATATVGSGYAPGNIQMDSSNVTCFGVNDATVEVNVNGGAQPYSYAWSNGDTTAIISSLAPGTYSVTVTTANGCITTGSATVSQPVIPLSYSSSQTNVTCNGGSDGSASVNVTGGWGSYTYNWNTVASHNTASVSNLAAGNYTCEITDGNGCVMNATFVISEPAPLMASAMVINNVTCHGLSNGYAIVGASGGTGIYTYTWNTSPAQTSQSINGLSAGNYSVQVMDANNCTANSSVTITEPAPLSLASAAFPVSCNGSCDGQGIIIPAGGTPGYTYQWLPDGGTGASAAGLCPGTYTATVTDGNGCTINASLSVTQPAVITVSASGSTTICQGQNTQISASASGGSGSYTYNWTGIGTGATQIVSPSVATTYSVTAMDANGCASSASSVSISVTSLTAANLVVSGASAICYGNSTTVSSAVSGNTGPVTVNWSAGLGNGNGPFVVSPASTITYTVTVTDACGHSVTGSVPVTVNPLPVISLTPQSVTACGDATVSFAENSGTNYGGFFNWSFGDGNFSSFTMPTHTYDHSGNFIIDLTVTSVQGCENSGSTVCHVIVNKPSVADFSTEALDGTTISPEYKFYDQSRFAASYSWDFGDGSTSTVASPQHLYASKGNYRVTLITASNEGCMDTISKDVEIMPVFTLYIPNAFTPDGNNTNDYFTAKGDEITEFKMMIFDRWGEMIFQTNDIQTGWDGTANNGSKVAEDGVYVYKITVKDYEYKSHAYVGHVTLLNEE